MASASADPAVAPILAGLRRWAPELAALRSLALASELEERVKWRWPCYTLNGANVVLIHAFKDYVALLFFKGALLDNADGALIRQTQNVHASRQMRFRSLAEIEAATARITAAIAQATEMERAGRQVEKGGRADPPAPAEWSARLKADPDLASAFARLTPGRRRYYLLHFGGAKQARTREARIEACVQKILSGKGLMD